MCNGNRLFEHLHTYNTIYVSQLIIYNFLLRTFALTNLKFGDSYKTYKHNMRFQNMFFLFDDFKTSQKILYCTFFRTKYVQINSKQRKWR